MKYAYTQNNAVVQVLRVPPTNIYAPELAEQFIECPDEVEPGWLWDGEQFTAPPLPPLAERQAEVWERIKAERLMQQDYTRKTMSHAEERRAFESERENFTRERQVAEQLENERFQMRAIDTRMQQIAQALPQVSQQNPELAQQLRDEFMQLQGVRPRLEGSIAQKQQQMQLAQQQTHAKLFSDAQTFLMREIKDWSPAKDAELEGYAKGLGINTQQLGQFLLRNPAIAVALDKAQKWDKSVKERLSTIKKPAPAPEKPASRIEGGKAKTQKSVSDMSPAEYREFRRKSAGR